MEGFEWSEPSSDVFFSFFLFSSLFLFFFCVCSWYPLESFRIAIDHWESAVEIAPSSANNSQLLLFRDSNHENPALFLFLLTGYTCNSRTAAYLPYSPYSIISSLKQMKVWKTKIQKCEWMEIYLRFTTTTKKKRGAWTGYRLHITQGWHSAIVPHRMQWTDNNTSQSDDMYARASVIHTQQIWFGVVS